MGRAARRDRMARGVRVLHARAHGARLRANADAPLPGLRDRISAMLKVYWRPGCSSCVRVKEFLTGLGVPYESINVSARPEAMEELRELGVRTVPVVARGREYVFAQELADVSEFIGRKVDFRRLPPEALYRKWQAVLAAAQRHVTQIPAERLKERATPGR